MAIIETVVDSIKSYIEDALPDYLESEYESSSDKLSLPMFETIYIGDHDISSIESLPALMFRYGTISIEEITTQTDEYLFHITFWMIVSDSTYDYLQRRLFRYTHAMKSIFDVDRTLGGIATETRVRTIEYSPVMNNIQIGFIDTEIIIDVTRRS